MFEHSSFRRPAAPGVRVRKPVMPLPLAGSTMLRSIERNGARWTFFDARDVPRIRAEAKHTYFCLPAEPDREWWLNESLDGLGKRLAAVGFVRVHRKELINLRFLRAVERSRRDSDRSVVVELRDGQRVPVSRRLTGHLRQALAALVAPSPPPGSVGAA